METAAPVIQDNAPEIPLYPVVFMDKYLWTWKGKACEQFLKPQVTASVLSEHDYVLLHKLFTKDYLNTLYTAAIMGYTAHGIGQGISTVWKGPTLSPQFRVMGRAFRVPIIPVASGILIALGLGKLTHNFKHVETAEKLQDPQGVYLAMRQVQDSIRATYQAAPHPDAAWLFRRGKDMVAFHPLKNRDLLQSASQQVSTDINEGEQSQFYEEEESDAVDMRPEGTSIRQTPATSRQRSRWDEIRQHNISQGKQSTWDSIRQAHERKTLDGLKSDSSDGSESREASQARFDAMLEEERRKSR